MKIYISGQITGNKNYKKIFNNMEQKLNSLGYKAVNPISDEDKIILDWYDAMKKDISKLMKCDSILLLKNWEKSKGAKIEKQLAEDLNLKIFYEESFFNKKQRKKIIFISGKKRSGKGTVAKMLKKILINADEILFSSLVKQWTKEDFSILIKALNKIFKENNLSQYVTTNKHWGNGEKSLISRLLLQIYGTNIFRNRIDSNFWIKKIEEKIIKSNKNVFIISDVRFPNEIEYFAKRDFDVFTIRVERQGINNKDEHESEKALDNYKNFDVIIENNSTKKELFKKIKQINFCCNK